MDVQHDPFPALTPVNCNDMLPLQREAIENYFNMTGIPRFRRMCMAALAATPINATHDVPAELNAQPGWSDDMVNMACATVFMRTGVHVDADDMRAGIERAIANR